MKNHGRVRASFGLPLGISIALLSVTGCRSPEIKTEVGERPEAYLKPASIQVKTTGLPFPVLREVEQAYPVLELSAAQQQEIAARLAGAGITRPWFGVLHLNRAELDDETRREYELTVFLMPTTTTPHYRLGSCLRLSNRAAAEASAAAVTQEYIQVLSASKELEDRNGIPNVTNLPFCRDPKMSVADTLEAVLVARQLGIDRESIGGVEKPEPETYEIHSCSCSQPDAYRGRWIKVQKGANGKWHLAEEGIWLD